MSNLAKRRRLSLRGLKAAAFFLLLSLSAAPSCRGEAAQRLEFEGRLVNPATKDPFNGSLDSEFRLCDSLAGACTGGSLLWTEFKTIFVATGVFRVELGDVVAVSSAVLSGPAQYLEVVVEGEALSPRRRLLSAPMVYRAAAADSLAPGAAGYLHAGETLQQATTFYVSSATVAGNFAVIGKLTVGGDASVAGALTVEGVLTAGSGEHQLTTSEGLLAPAKLDAATMVPNESIDPSSAVKLNALGGIDNALLSASSVTKQGNTFNLPDRLAALNGAGLVPSALLSNSSVTKLGSAYNLPDGPVKLRSDGFIESYLLDSSSVAKVSAAGFIPGALLDSSSVTMQGNVLNSAGRLYRLDSGANAALIYGVASATAVFTQNVGVNEAAPDEALHVTGVNAKVESGQWVARNSDIVFSTTTGSRGITFQDASRQRSEPRWELIGEVASADPVSFGGLDGDLDDIYLLVFYVAADGAVEWGVRFNADGTLNYQYHNLNTLSGTNGLHSDSISTDNEIKVPGDFAQAGGDFFQGEMTIHARTGQKRYVVSQDLRSDGGNLEMGIGGGWWNDTSSNITSINIVGSFGAASRFTLYRRPR